MVDKVVGAGGEEPFLERLAHATPANPVTIAFLVCWWLFFGLAFAFRRAAKRLLLGFLVAGFLLGSIVFGSLAAVHAWVDQNVTEAVVMPQTAKVREFPGEAAKVAFEVHSGLKVRVMEESGKFVRIRLPNGLEGWTEKEGSRRAVIEVRNVTKVYHRGKTEVRALALESLSVPKGQFLSVMGSSGSGKSTLLNLLGALDVPTSGSITIDGKEICQLPDDELSRFRRDRLGFIFQFFNLLPTLTAVENVVLPQLLSGGSRAQLLAEGLGAARVGGPQGPRRPPPRRALRRRDAARGGRPRAARRAGAAPGRRADRQPRLQDGRRGAAADSRGDPRAQPDRGDGDARREGRRGGRPHRAPRRRPHRGRRPAAPAAA